MKWFRVPGCWWRLAKSVKELQCAGTRRRGASHSRWNARALAGQPHPALPARTSPCQEPEIQTEALSPDSLSAFVFSPRLPHLAVSSSSFSSTLSLFLEIPIECPPLKGLSITSTTPSTAVSSPALGRNSPCILRVWRVEAQGSNSTRLRTLFWASDLKADELRLVSEAWADSNPEGRK